MPISDEEYSSIIGRLRVYAKDLVETYDDRNTIVGNIGEKFVGYCIFHALWRLGYPINFKNLPHSYKLEAKFGADDQGRGGVDFKLDIVDLDENKYHFLIESKNWKQYPSVSNNWFEKNILNRFTRVENNKEYHWIITMNVNNFEDIFSRCIEHKIRILPINYQITPDNIQSDVIMRSLISNFIDSLTLIIKQLAPDRSYPKIPTGGYGVNRAQYITQDLLLGVPTHIIEQRYKRSRTYISRLASYIRSWNIPLPDKRKKDWREIWELQE